MGCAQGQQKKKLGITTQNSNSFKILGLDAADNKFANENSRITYQFSYLYYKPLIFTNQQQGNNLTLVSTLNYSSQTNTYVWNMSNNTLQAKNYFQSQSPDPEKTEMSNFIIFPITENPKKVRIFLEFAEFFIESSDQLVNSSKQANQFNLRYTQSLQNGTVWDIQMINKELNEYSFKNEETGLYLSCDESQGYLGDTQGNSTVWVIFESLQDIPSVKGLDENISRSFDQEGQPKKSEIPLYLKTPISHLMGFKLKLKNFRFGNIIPYAEQEGKTIVVPSEKFEESEGQWEIFYLSGGYIVYHISSKKFLVYDNETSLFTTSDFWDRTRFQFIELPNKDGYLISILLLRDKYISINQISSKLVLSITEIQNINDLLSDETIWKIELKDK